MLALAKRAVGQKVAKWQAGKGWDSALCTAWKEIGGKPRRNTVHGEVWGVQDRSKRKDRNKGKASAKKQGEGGGTLEIYSGGFKIRKWNYNVFARPNGLREDAETAISCGGPAKKKKEVYQ